MFKCRQGTCRPALRKHANIIDHQHKTRSNKSLVRLPLIKRETAKKFPLLSRPILIQRTSKRTYVPLNRLYFFNPS